MTIEELERMTFTARGSHCLSGLVQLGTATVPSYCSGLRLFGTRKPGETAEEANGVFKTTNRVSRDSCAMQLQCSCNAATFSRPWNRKIQKQKDWQCHIMRHETNDLSESWLMICRQMITAWLANIGKSTAKKWLHWHTWENWDDEKKFPWKSLLVWGIFGWLEGRPVTLPAHIRHQLCQSERHAVPAVQETREENRSQTVH